MCDVACVSYFLRFSLLLLRYLYQSSPFKIGSALFCKKSRAAARKVRRQAIGHTVSEVFLLGNAADIGEGEHNEGETWLTRLVFGSSAENRHLDPKRV